MSKLEFHRLQDKFPDGQFIARRHYNITDKVFDFVEDEQLKLKKANRKDYPTKADMYYQLIIEGLKHSDKVTFKNLLDNHTVRLKISKPVNKQIVDVQNKINADELSSQRGYSKNGNIQTINLFSIAVCLMEAAIDNQK